MVYLVILPENIIRMYFLKMLGFLECILSPKILAYYLPLNHSTPPLIKTWLLTTTQFIQLIKWAIPQTAKNHDYLRPLKS